jgi:hypothetical protein
MTIDTRIPEFTDKELENLHDNAVRLAQSGKPAQKAEAERLLPLIAVELEVRVKAKAVDAADRKIKRRDATAATRKRKAAAAANEQASKVSG